MTYVHKNCVDMEVQQTVWPYQDYKIIFFFSFLSLKLVDLVRDSQIM